MGNVAGVQVEKDCRFMAMNFPPLQGIGDNTFDSCLSLQVIEHIRDDAGFVREIFRVLKPGGVAMITTPNRKMSLTRNPWHIREYDPESLARLVSGIFGNAEMLGITGNEKVMNYHEENRKSVNSITRFDILKLQYRLPAAVLKIPYELMNRLNRNRLKQNHTRLVTDITYEDYLVTDHPGEALDLLCLMRKN